MNLINQVTLSPRQKQSIPIADGTTFDIAIYFIPMQLGWFIEELTYGDFVLTGLRITNSPNMLHQFKNQIPFGLACLSKNNREPSQQEDFSSGNSSLYILSQEEVEEYGVFLSE